MLLHAGSNIEPQQHAKCEQQGETEQAIARPPLVTGLTGLHDNAASADACR